MDDEIEIFTAGRPAAPPYPSEAREEARRNLLAEGGRRRFRTPRFGWQAAGAFGLTVALIGGIALALPSWTGGSAARPGAAATESASVASSQGMGELSPKPGQFLLFESETMYTAEYAGDSTGTDTARYLYRTQRKIWSSADGSAPGLLSITGLEPRALPGLPLPAEATRDERESWHQIAGHCPGSPDVFRTDYAYLSGLPSDGPAMRDYLYERDHGGQSADDGVFTAVGDLTRENYMPRAQRQALFEAAKTIPGVKVADGVKDAAGRAGVAVGREENGVLTQLVFDPDTFLFLGERGTVVDEKTGRAPVGTVVALTAQLKVSVVDRLPEAEGAARDGSCDVQERPATPPAGDYTMPTTKPSSRTPM
ncbi:CU044_5270 family protein [Sphaerisporangium corydalis]|uniref:CU044_5270 family protein n=1 Tax=Sphaerisporangium corydalis TaxID=1441875 RepID=A0ABV9EP37_9ACTN|nr:CU044_5270 family protein [Sphaerisporangium corydalis]